MKRKLGLYAALATAILAMYPSSARAATSVKTSIGGQPGAVGNGITDDTAAIDRAINADDAVYFPPGRYKYTNPNRMLLPGGRSFHLFGDGPGVSTIEFYGSPYNGILMRNTGRRTLRVEGLTLKAMTGACGDAITAEFSDASPGPEGPKTRTVTVRNVQIRGTDRNGSPTGYWDYGIYLWQAQNSIIDDVQFEGRFQTGTGIFWGGAENYATTQLFVTNISMLYFAKAVQTSGHVEGFYMSGFELVGVGTYNSMAMDLHSSANDGSHHLPTFHLLNGHINFVGGGVHCRNLSSVKVANVNFAHVGFNVGVGGQGSGTHLYLDDVWGANVSHSDFAGTPGVPYENGVFASTGSSGVHVTGCTFNLSPGSGGSALVALSGTSGTRWLDNAFGGSINRYDNYAGSATYIRDIP